jgi:nucleotide-binding universal stress UspA family protein
MTKIERILCPTNLSSKSDEALRYAVALAFACEAKLFLLHCISSGSNGYKSERQTLNDQVTRSFRESLDSHLGLADLSELNWEGLVAENIRDVGKAIAQEAEKHNIDLIVMRSRRRPHAAVLLGSTAEAVSRIAPCPVLVTHQREREWVGSTGEIDLRRILVAYDFSSDSELALNYGIQLAQEYQAELHLLHVLSNPEQEEPELAWTQLKTETAYTSAARKLQRAIPKEVCLWCKAVTSVQWGRTYQQVLVYARDHEVDVICMGASGSDFGVGSLFGSNVDRVLRQAPCPVLVARPLKPVDSSTYDTVEALGLRDSQI